MQNLFNDNFHNILRLWDFKNHQMLNYEVNQMLDHIFRNLLNVKILSSLYVTYSWVKGFSIWWKNCVGHWDLTLSIGNWLDCLIVVVYYWYDLIWVTGDWSGEVIVLPLCRWTRLQRREGGRVVILIKDHECTWIKNKYNNDVNG